MGISLRTLAPALVALALSAPAHAGFIEIGASGSFRRSNIDVDAYDESLAVTGSLSYYFSESTAIEASYTDGQNKRVISENVANGHVTKMFYKTAGLDFVLSFGGKESAIRPYLKVGGNYIISKRIVDQYRDANNNLYPANVIEDEPGLVPSFGAGFKLGLTESLSLKLGVDGWTSRPTNKPPVTVDYVGRAGLSLMF